MFVCLLGCLLEKQSICSINHMGILYHMGILLIKSYLFIEYEEEGLWTWAVLVCNVWRVSVNLQTSSAPLLLEAQGSFICISALGVQTIRGASTGTKQGDIEKMKKEDQNLA